MLGSLDAATIASRLAAQPMIAAGVAGVGPLATLFGAPLRPGARRVKPVGTHALAKGLTHGVAVDYLRLGLSRPSAQLWQVALWHGGELSHDQAVAEVAGFTADQLDAARQGLVDAFLAVLVPSAGGPRLRLLPHAVACGRLPGNRLRTAVLGNRFTNDHLDQYLRSLGCKPPPRRAEKAEALLEAVGDQATVLRVIGRLSGAAQRALQVIMSASHGVAVNDVGGGYFSASHPRYGRRYGTPSVLDDLAATGLIGVDERAQWCWVWMEVQIALHGRVCPVWRAPAEVHTVALTPSSTMAAAPAHMARLLEAWATERVPALKNGGLSQRSVKATAKRLTFADDNALLLALAAERMGLIDEEMEIVGKGRALDRELYTHTNSAGLAWVGQSLAARWASLVVGWVDSPASTKYDDPQAAVVELGRRFLVADLQALPDGQGVPSTALATWLAGRRMLFEDQAPAVERLLGELRYLGLVPPTGAVGLTALGRALLSRPGAVAGLLPTTVDSFVVQADHTVIAPPDLSPEVRAGLDRMAVVESTGAATTLRLDSSRMAAAFAAGDDAANVLAFLREHSSVPVPKAVERFVLDAERAQGGLQLAAAATVLTAADPAVLARATAVRASGLRMLAPTVAVSALAPDKVLAELRKKGIHPTADAITRPRKSTRSAAGSAAAGRAAMPAAAGAAAPAPAGSQDAFVGIGQPDLVTLQPLIGAAG